MATTNSGHAANMHASIVRRYARRIAGWALSGLAPRQKQIADVLGVTQSNVSRQIAGEQDGDVSRFYQVVRRAVRDKRRTGRLIAGALSAAQDEAQGLPPAACRRALDLALDRETEAQTTEDQAQHRVLRAIRAGDVDELATAIEAHDDALCDETAAHADVLYFGRAYVAALRAERRKLS